LIKIKRLIATAALSLFAFSAVGCSIIAKTPEAIQKTVLAKVQGQEITRGDVDEIAEYYLLQYGEDYDTNEELADTVKSIRTQALSMLVEEKILELKATELELLPTDEEVTEEVNTYIENLKTSLGGDNEFNTALEEAGYTLESYTETLMTSRKMQLISDKVMEYIFKDIAVDDAAVETYYNKNIDAFTTGDVSHILVSDETLANEIREKALNGEDFAKLAKEYSEDNGTAEKGGSLGSVSFASTTYLTEFMDGVRSLKDGGISEPVKSKYGYHIIKVENVKVATLEESKESIVTTLENEQKSTLYYDSIKQWEKDYNVKKYENRL